MKRMMTMLIIATIGSYLFGIYFSKNKKGRLSLALAATVGFYVAYILRAQKFVAVNILPNWPYELGGLSVILAMHAALALTGGQKKLGIGLVLLTTLSVLAVPLFYHYFGR